MAVDVRMDVQFLTYYFTDDAFFTGLGDFGAGVACTANSTLSVLVRLLIRFAIPRDRGLLRLRVGPLVTETLFITNSSEDVLKLLSAFATAEEISLANGNAARLPRN